MARRVFFSFHFDKDVMRVQQIRNIGAIEGNKPVTPQKWEEVKKQGKAAIEKWIDDNMLGKSCVVVLVGEDTAKRPWVDYEIRKGWDSGKAVLGVYIHNIKCPNSGTGTKGANPFAKIGMKSGKKLSDYVQCYNPKTSDAYNDIANNIDSWIEDAIQSRN